MYKIGIYLSANDPRSGFVNTNKEENEKVSVTFRLAVYSEDTIPR